MAQTKHRDRNGDRREVGELDGVQNGAEIEVEELTPEELDSQRIAEELLAHENWSQKIRYLHSEGFRNSSISHILSQLRGYPLSPQHVNNVLRRPLKSPPSGGNGGGRGRPKSIDDRADKVVVSLLRKTPKTERTE